MIIRYGGACCCGATAGQIALTRTGEELCKADLYVCTLGVLSDERFERLNCCFEAGTILTAANPG